MTDFRAELRALLAAIEDDVIDTNDSHRFQRAVARAEAALAQFEPIDPPKEKAASAAENQLFPWRVRDAALAQPGSEAVTPSSAPVVYTEAMAADDDDLLKGVTVDAATEEPEPEGPTRRILIINPVQIAECGGPCFEDGPEACDCGALWRDEPVSQPEPEGPTLPPGYIDLEHIGDDREMLATFYAACCSEGGTADEIYLRGLRAVLARWGNHPGSPDSSTEPTPVSERLPGPGDCDAEGRCWWFYPESFSQSDLWCYSRGNEIATHWLPAHALPVPTDD